MPQRYKKINSPLIFNVFFRTFAVMKLYINDELNLISEREVDEIISNMPDQRREQALRFTHLQGRKECAVAYMLLCRGLREMYGVEDKPIFRYGVHGKPVIVGHEDIHFNISHCKRAVVCVISDEEVGVDVECTDRGNENLIRYTMNDEEQRLISSAPDSNVEFIRLWTMKEALLKYTGHGITDDMKTVLLPENTKDVDIRSFVVKEKNYAYSIACKKGAS